MDRSGHDGRHGREGVWVCSAYLLIAYCLLLIAYLLLPVARCFFPPLPLSVGLAARDAKFLGCLL